MTRTGKRICRRRRNNSFIFSSVYFILTFLYMEAVFHIAEFGNGSVLFPVLFAVPAGFLFAFITDLFPEKTGRILRYVLSIAVMVLFGTQVVYFHSFQAFMSMSQVGMGGDVFTNFFKSILLAIWETLPTLLLLFLPLLPLTLLQKRFRPENRFTWQKSLLLIVCFVLTQTLSVLLLPLGGTAAHTAYDNFYSNWVLDLSVEKLGLLTTTAIDLKNLIFRESTLPSEKPDVPIPVPIPGQTSGTTPPAPPVSGGTTDGDAPSPESPYNIIEGLDFAALAEQQTDETARLVMQYLAALEPTKKNQYTGLFRDCNLILICAESFSPMAIHEELTPTLWKLSHSGFVFENYWTMYPSNTTNGEYSLLTGLIPDLSKPKADGSFLASSNNTMNLTAAAYFNALGVTSRAYHNHTGSYYKRNVTHPNLGFLFKGKEEIGGLSGWPESDLTMMQRTLPEYIGDDRFFAYYMTVSGHHNYKFGGLNSIADKNKDLVSHLDMSDAAKAYLACNIELDRAVGYLISELEKAGKLENTVICISPDHYPYGLTDKEYRDMLGHSFKYDALERYCSTLILWNSEMETVSVDKPCGPVDVLPTLLNLFGFRYDSRLYSGCDILSDSYGLAMISNQSFITDKLVYNSRYGTTFSLDKSWKMPEGYLDAYLQIVRNRFSIASNILNLDLYAKLPADLIAAAQKPRE